MRKCAKYGLQLDTSLLDSHGLCLALVMAGSSQLQLFESLQ